MRHTDALTAPTSSPDYGHAITADSGVRVPPHVVFRAFPGETLVLNLETGLYHSLNSTGGRMLELLREFGLVRAVADRLAAEYERCAERLVEELCDYCAVLAEHGLVELEPPA
jgi:hypothetical protein